MNNPLEVELTQTGARYNQLELLLPEDMAMQEWAEIGRKLVRTDQVLKWWLGDWAAFGIRKYESLKDFANANNINYGTLRNLAHVSQSVELSRRRDNVEWSKHAEVAELKPKEQEQWLDKVVFEEMPISELRRQIRVSQAKPYLINAGDGIFVKYISKSCADLSRWLKNRPSDFWDDDRKTKWREWLKPIVEVYNSIKD